MKRIILLALSLVLTVSLNATLSITSGGKYYFVCDLWESGNMVLGAQHGKAPFIFYDSDAQSLSTDSYWVITKAQGGRNSYTIQNAVTKEYIVYKDERLTNDKGEYTAKGLQLAASVTDNNGKWNFHENANGSVYITCVGNSSICFDVRTDGSGLVGTYNVGNSPNQYFHIYDEQGKCISSNATTGGGETGGGTEKPTGNAGVTSDGFYWENTGLQQPIVLTTQVSNPVLYTIQNARSGQYVQVESNGMQVLQAKSEPTKFYFMQNGSGISIFTQDGDYVSTSFWTYDEGKYPLTVAYGSLASNKHIWEFGHYADYQYPGYTIGKLDNLPQTDASQSKYLYWNDYNLGAYHCVGLYDVDGGSTFVFFSNDTRHKTYLEGQGIDFSGSGSGGSGGGGTTPSGQLSTYVDSLRIAGKDLVYDTKAGMYYCSVPSAVMNAESDWTTTVYAKYKRSDGTYNVSINNVAADAEGNVTIASGMCAKDGSVAILKDGQAVATAPLVFTYLPLVEVNVSSCNGNYYTTGQLRVTDPDIATYDSLVIAAFKYRGATAQGYAKKSYAIKLRDADGNSVDREYFALRNDNNWILDAMAIDKACMRNRVSTDLWNDFATKPLQRRMKWEPKAKHGTRGRFVEVFLNGQYHGIYCFTEKMDRKQLRLKKFVPATATSADTIHGSLYKSTDWSYEVFMGHSSGSNYFPKTQPSSYYNNNRQEGWCGYEVKYPDYEEEKIDWGPLWNAINFTATSSDAEFQKDFSRYFEQANIVDYYLFIELMLATDNHGKNMFFYNYDQLSETVPDLIGVAPWDLDGTWGRRWDGNNYLTGAQQDFTNFLWAYEHGTHTIFHRLDQLPSMGWSNALKARYAELRVKDFLVENLQQRFRDYANLFHSSRADLREQNRWSSLHSDITGDVDYICNWIEQRVNYLDDQYGFDLASTSIEDAATTPYYNIVGGKGCISIHATSPVSLRVYTIGGQLVRSIEVNQAHTIVDGFQPGIYVVGGQKVAVK